MVVFYTIISVIHFLIAIAIGTLIIITSKTDNDYGSLLVKLLQNRLDDPNYDEIDCDVSEFRADYEYSNITKMFVCVCALTPLLNILILLAAIILFKACNEKYTELETEFREEERERLKRC